MITVLMMTLAMTGLAVVQVQLLRNAWQLKEQEFPSDLTHVSIDTIHLDRTMSIIIGDDRHRNQTLVKIEGPDQHLGR